MKGDTVMKLSEIRKEAREALSGKWGKAACITLAFMVISFVVGFVQKLVGEESIIYDIIDLVYVIINIPLSLGLLVCFIKLRRGEEVNPFDYFQEGFSRFKKAWGIWAQTLLKLLVPTICLIILILVMTYLIFSGILLQEVSSSSLLVVTILLIATSIYMTVKSLLYVYAYNISYDNPELSAKECVLKSAELMKGNRCKYFLLELSFIGWAILAVIPFGIGILWLAPYIQIAAICFYERLLKPQTEKTDDVINTKE